jgi:uncharacterized protein (DUF4415 family)
MKDIDEAPELTQEVLQQTKSIKDFPELGNLISDPAPVKSKVTTTLQLDLEVVEYFQENNPENWQRHINDTLMDFIKR